MEPGNSLAAAILEGRATDLEIIAADLRTSGIQTYNIERQSRQLQHNARQIREGQQQTPLHQ